MKALVEGGEENKGTARAPFLCFVLTEVGSTVSDLVGTEASNGLHPAPLLIKASECELHRQTSVLLLQAMHEYYNHNTEL